MSRTRRRAPRPSRAAARRAPPGSATSAARGSASCGARLCSECWPCCCAWCSASRSPRRSARPIPATRWRPPDPADLLVLLDSLQQREAALNTEVADLQRTLAALQASGSSDQAAIENAQARLAALSILIGTVAATGPGVTLTIDDPAAGRGRRDDARRDQRVARGGRRGDGDPRRATARPVRVGVDTWVVGSPGRARRSTVHDPEPAVFGCRDWRSADTGCGDEHPRRSDGQRRTRRAARWWCNSPTGSTSPPCGNRNRANTLSPSNDA